ncbi:hypothetical protein LINPERHAP1_LOCUS13161 [Linum perenne]
MILPRSNECYLDSGCSHHMTGDKRLFSTLLLKKGGKVTFGDNKKGRILGQGSVGIEGLINVAQIWK